MLLPFFATFRKLNQLDVGLQRGVCRELKFLTSPVWSCWRGGYLDAIPELYGIQLVAVLNE